MSDVELQVINAETEDNLTGILINGTPYLYWLRVYQALGLERHHAQKVVSRLTEGTHYRKFSKEELLQLSETGNTVLPVDHRAKSFVFLTAEGLNRAIMEIRTCEMDNEEIAASINAKKDHIANIFTRYQRGEVLSIANERPALPGKVPLSEALKEELARAAAMAIVGVDVGRASSVCIAKVEDEYGEDLSYLRNLLVRQIEGEIGYLTATAIGKELGLSNQSVNKILEKQGYQYLTVRVKSNGKSQNIWNLTERGKQFGEIHMGRFGGHETYTIMWRSSVVEVLRRVMFHPEQQTTLSGVVA